MDREFFSAAAVIHEIKQNRDMFLMPERKTPGIKKAIIEYVNGDRKSISTYTIKSVSEHIESFTLVVIPRPNAKKASVADQYIVFATNIPMNKIFWNLHTLPEEYRKRWVWEIETGYACIEKFRPRTTSRNQSMRFICFFLSYDFV